MKRPNASTDDYGNTVPGALAAVKTLQALVAPQITNEPKLLGRSAIETNYNVFLEGVVNSGILPTDTLNIRGEDTPVDGRIAVWNEPPYGTQIQVRLVNG